MKRNVERTRHRAEYESIAEGRRTIVLGTGSLARRIIRAIVRNRRGVYQLLGAIDAGGSPAMDDGDVDCRILGPINRMEKILAAYNPDCVIVAVTEGKLEIMERLLLFLMHSGASVRSGVDVYEELTGQVPIDTLTPDDVVFSYEMRPGWLAVHVNRLISLSLAFLGIFLTSPLMGLLAIAIRLDSKGPAIYVQDRAGLNGRRFRLLKFRTMRLDAPERSVWAAENADRITRVGEWLRKFRLDELPQLFNVIRGDMNIVGPRPHPSPSSELVDLISRNAAECGVAIPYYSMRSMVRPGITGWAQVRYKYANGLGEEIQKLRYDLYYIKHYSVLLDLRILVMTLGVVASGSGNGRLKDRPLAQGPANRRLSKLPYVRRTEENTIGTDMNDAVPKPLMLAIENDRPSEADR